MLGILSILVWLGAVLTVALPLVSMVYPSPISISANQAQQPSGGAQLSVAPSYTVTNHGFLPIDGLYVNVVGLNPDGSQLFAVKTGPVDLTPGSSTQVQISTGMPSVSPGSQAAQSGVTLELTATANLGGLIPITVTANFLVPLNSTGAVP